MNAVHTVTFALVLAFSASAHADYLPDSKAAEAALWGSPMVSQARGEFAAQSLKSQGLQHGHAEWAVSADVAQRRIQTTPRESQAEWGVALSRPLRLPAVAAADRTLAGALTAHAEAN
ncbi:MAG: TolC family protein, partial [Gammaproteobacteria bacterium]|nr:TolC family protein [Gammaproteobacteria bacterium]